MRSHLSFVVGLILAAEVGGPAAAEPASPSAPRKAFLLQAVRQVGDVARVEATLEVGGTLSLPEKSQAPKQLPLSVVAKTVYDEQVLTWPATFEEPARSLRRYAEAQATIKNSQQGTTRTLEPSRRLVVAELGPRGPGFRSLAGPLTRDQFDLVNLPANTLALDRLLPDRRLAEGESWDHDQQSLGPLLGMDHVAACDVRSVVVGEEQRQVKIRLAGSVQGTVDGAATEMMLRAAYLFHLDQRRITKFNLAIEERRDPGQVSPGLDVVARLSLTARPPAQPVDFPPTSLEDAARLDAAAIRELVCDAPQLGVRFQHDAAWFDTATQREGLSLRLLSDGEMLAHCNVTARPGPGPAKPPSLQKFEADVVASLGDQADKVEAASEWTTAAGCRCVAVVAEGAVDGVPIQWRYYRLWQADRPLTTMVVTVEQRLVDAFADADRPLVESLELLTPTPPESPQSRPATAARDTPAAK